MAHDAAKRRPGFRIAMFLLGLAAVGGVVYLASGKAADDNSASPVQKVTRGNLKITVLEGGNLQSLKSVQVISQVEGQAKIISIVPEGSIISPEDVAAGKILVELDSSDLRDKLNRQELSVADATSAVTQGEAALDIARNQNESDVRRADLAVRFARIDLEKYLGTAVADQAAAARARDGEKADLKGFAKDEGLDGQSLVDRRRRETDIVLATEEKARATDKLIWTEKLLEKGYVSNDEKVADGLALKRQEVALEQANTALSIFQNYEFPKTVETLLSNHREAQESSGRVQARAKSSEAQATADLKGREERKRLEEDRLAKVKDQLAACTVRAEAPGLVVYASSDDNDHYGGGDASPIQEGSMVRERQAIIRLPDLSNMGVRVNVHESAMDKVKVGQRAQIVVDAFRGTPFRGKVAKIGTIPNSANRWQNPDLKVYSTDVTIENAPLTLRPGMSAKVEILIEELESVLSVPVQAITGGAGSPVVYVRTDSGDVAKPVKTGASNDRFVEVREGLSEGDLVLLAPPRDSGLGGPKSSDKADKGGKSDGSGRSGEGRGNRGKGKGGGAPEATSPPDAPGGAPVAPISKPPPALPPPPDAAAGGSAPRRGGGG